MAQFDWACKQFYKRKNKSNQETIKGVEKRKNKRIVLDHLMVSNARLLNWERGELNLAVQEKG